MSFQEDFGHSKNLLGPARDPWDQWVPARDPWVPIGPYIGPYGLHFGPYFSFVGSTYWPNPWGHLVQILHSGCASRTAQEVRGSGSNRPEGRGGWGERGARAPTPHPTANFPPPSPLTPPSCTAKRRASSTALRIPSDKLVFSWGFPKQGGGAVVFYKRYVDKQFAFYKR